VYNSSMALRKIDEIKKEAAGLTQEEKLELAEFLIRDANRHRYTGKVVDLNKYAGIVKLREDPLEYQKRVRAEWP